MSDSCLVPNSAVAIDVPADPVATAVNDSPDVETNQIQSATSAESQDDAPVNADDDVDDDDTNKGGKGVKRQSWRACEVIAGFKVSYMASTRKQTSTKLYRAKHMYESYPKIASDLKVKGLWPKDLDIIHSRNLRCAYAKEGKNVGESPLSRKVAEIKREAMNQVLPIWKRLLPGGKPPSGTQWGDVHNKLKDQYYQIWRMGQQRFKDKTDMPAGWSCLVLDVFFYCGPPGLNLDILQDASGSSQEIDTSRAGAREAERASKKAKLDDAGCTSKQVPNNDSKGAGRLALAQSLDAQNRTMMLRLLLAHGNEDQKAVALNEIVKTISPGDPCDSHPTTQTPSTHAKSPTVRDYMSTPNTSNTIFLEFEGSDEGLRTEQTSCAAARAAPIVASSL